MLILFTKNGFKELKEFPKNFTGSFDDPLSLKILNNEADIVCTNPPFSRVGDGVHSLPQDEQRRFARFELRGGIEDYCAVAQRLLRPAGRFILAFWHKDNGLKRVQAAAAASGLYCTRRVDVVGGSPTNSQPHISIFEFALLSAARNDAAEQAAEQVVSLDIRRDSTTGGLSPKYKEICRSLGLHGRPLKIKIKTKKTHN
jgi:tRNA1(Val) A37 N6-methylase TrmN6